MKKTTLICCFISLCIVLISCSHNTSDGALEGVPDNPGEPVYDHTENSSDKITITLGGLYLYGELLLEVAAFNKESQTHRIQVIDYLEKADNNWEAAAMRLRTELITGKGPDILYDFAWSYINSNLFVDLYPFIDNDDELDRSDFFPNVLNAFEGTDGLLRFIANRFTIQTMIGIAEDLDLIDSWTPQDLIVILDDLTHMQTPLGDKMDSESFVRNMIAFSGDVFIDWEQYKANLDSEEFMRILEASRGLLNREGLPDINREDTSEFAKMLRREQLVSFTLLNRPRNYQEFTDALGNIRVIGIPTSQGGADFIVPYVETLGITASSEHKEEAWLFVRRFLQPPNSSRSAKLSEIFIDGFPLRIDLYEKLIAECMKTTAIAYTVDGSFSLGKMTQAEADNLSEIINNAKPKGQGLDIEIWRHIAGDLNNFYAGGKTVEETARIMQHRVQTYLDELS
jgi:ABC-type glycerol-3-phosphate transport system substrate-binding protein